MAWVKVDDDSFIASNPHLADFTKMLSELNKESERGQVLIICSYLDELLRRVLLAFLRDDPSSDRLVNGFNAPLGTLNTRINASYALGLITELEFKECEILRRIRNRFAHEVHMSFADQRIRDLCKNLSMAIPGLSADDAKGARAMLTSAAPPLFLNLNNRPHYVARKRRVVEKWPY